MMLERADTEMLDLVRSRARRLRQRAAEPAAEHPAQQREPFGCERTPTATRARTADGAALFEIERDQLVIGAPARRRVPHRSARSRRAADGSPRARAASRRTRA